MSFAHWASTARACTSPAARPLRALIGQLDFSNDGLDQNPRDFEIAVSATGSADPDFKTVIKATLPASQVNVIIEQAADEMVAGAPLPSGTMEMRLDSVVNYLNQHGYDASWEPCDEGYILMTRNCPYRQLAHEHEELCSLDFRLISGLTGIVPRRLGRIVEDDSSCAYLLPARRAAAENTKP